MTLPIPPFADPFLESVAESLRKRRKTLKHRALRFDVYKVYEQDEDETVERLDVRLEGVTAEKDSVLTMQVWPTRWVWLDARTPDRKKNVAWSWTYEGRALGNVSGRMIVAALEETFDSKYVMNPALTAEFTAIWKSLLARGPQEVR